MPISSGDMQSYPDITFSHISAHATIQSSWHIKYHHKMQWRASGQFCTEVPHGDQSNWDVRKGWNKGTWLLLLLLSSFSRVQLCATPQMAAHQPPSSLGFSRQEHWSGLPLPSPMHESEKWKWSCSVVSDSQQPHGLQPTRLLHPWDFPGKRTGVGCHCLLRKVP